MNERSRLVLGIVAGLAFGLIVGCTGGTLIARLFLPCSPETAVATQPLDQTPSMSRLHTPTPSRTESTPATSVKQITPSPVVSKAPADEPLEAQALAIYERIVREYYWIECENCWIRYDFQGYLNQFRGQVAFHIDPEELTPADRANGIEFIGFGMADVSGVTRRYEGDGWTEWWDADWAEWPTIKIKRVNGEWDFDLDEDRRGQTPTCDQLPGS